MVYIYIHSGPRNFMQALTLIIGRDGYGLRLGQGNYQKEERRKKKRKKIKNHKLKKESNNHREPK